MLKNKKVILSIILSVLLCLVSFTVNAKENSKIELRIEGPKTVEVGKTINLSAIQKISNDLGVEMPEGITSEYFNEENVTKAATWVTNSPVATVKDGNVTGVKEGTTTITAEYEKYTAQIVITVIKEKEEATGEEPKGDITEEEPKDLSGEKEKDLTEEKIEELSKEMLKYCTIDNIEVKKEPKKLKYKVGEKFDITGMEVLITYKVQMPGEEAHYFSIFADLKENLKFESAELTKDDNIVKITFTDGINTKEIEQKITVISDESNDGTRAKGKLPYAGGTIAMILASGLVIASGIYIFKRRNDLKGI